MPEGQQETVVKKEGDERRPVRNLSEEQKKEHILSMERLFAQGEQVVSKASREQSVFVDGIEGRIAGELGGKTGDSPEEASAGRIVRVVQEVGKGQAERKTTLINDWKLTEEIVGSDLHKLIRSPLPEEELKNLASGAKVRLSRESNNYSAVSQAFLEAVAKIRNVVTEEVGGLGSFPIGKKETRAAIVSLFQDFDGTSGGARSVVERNGLSGVIDGLRGLVDEVISLRLGI